MIVPPRNAVPKGFSPGSRCEARVSLLDLYPTLIAACSLPIRTEVEGKSLLPLVADPSATWKEAVVTTVGRGTHSVSTNQWRYIRYFDGSEELYDLRHDPHEWFNIASEPSHAGLKRQLAHHITEDKRFRQFVRWGRWKCVIPIDGDPMLFDYQGEFGISEQNDVAADKREVVDRIRNYLKKHQISRRRATIPTQEP